MSYSQIYKRAFVWGGGIIAAPPVTASPPSASALLELGSHCSLAAGGVVEGAIGRPVPVEGPGALEGAVVAGHPAVGAKEAVPVKHGALAEGQHPHLQNHILRQHQCFLELCYELFVKSREVRILR